MEFTARTTVSVDELKIQLGDSQAKLEQVGQASSLGFEGEKADALVSALHATVMAVSASMGECRKETPFAPLHPVLDANGNFKWCCNHASEHCGG
jgi:hypothetical protein